MPDAAAELVVYGIPNCDQVKKARRWLDARGYGYRFHDLRRDGVSESLLRRWLAVNPWGTLVNQKGTTWRNLSAADRPQDASSALVAMQAHPTLIKRPVVEKGPAVLVGFDEERLARLAEAH